MCREDGVETLTDLTVIIPTLGRPVLRQVAHALASSRPRPAAVVISHQGSDEETGRVAAELDAAGIPTTYVHRDERGAAAARNRAIERVRTPFVAALDDDCVPEPDWLRQMWDALQQHPAAIVTGAVLPDVAGTAPSLKSSVDPAVYREPLADRDVLFAANMGVRVALFRTIGPFDEAPVLRNAAQDNEWAYRAQRSDVPICYVPTVQVVHLDWRDREALDDVERRYARGQGGFFGLHARSGDAHIIRRAARDAGRRSRRALRCALRGRTREAVRQLSLLRQFLVGFAIGVTGGGRE